MFIQVTSKENGRSYLLGIAHIIAIGPNVDNPDEIQVDTTDSEIIVTQDMNYFMDILSQL